MTAGAHVDGRGIRPNVATSENLRDSWLLGGRELLELAVAWASLVLAGVGVGEFVLRPDDDNVITRLDDRVSTWLAGRRTPTWDRISWVGSMLAETAVKVVVTGVIVAVMLRTWHRWLEPTVVAIALVLEAAAFITITVIVRRPRPDVPRLDGSPVDSSFPSGHVAAAAAYGALAVVFLWRGRRVVARVLLGAVALVVVAVGLARTYRGMHFLSDVVAGVVLGVASVVVTAVIVRRADRRRLDRRRLDSGVVDAGVVDAGALGWTSP